MRPAEMKHPTPEATWPDSWRLSYEFDLSEVYGKPTHLGYAYAYQTRRHQTLALLTGAVPPPAQVLDIAAAQGNFSLGLAELGYRVTWNDLRAELAGYVQRKHERGCITYAPGDAFTLRFDVPFDAVLITEVIEHVAHPDQFLRNTAQLVKRGGYVVMTTPNGAYVRNTLPRFSDCADPSQYEAGQFKPDADGHIFLLWPDEVRRLAADAGLAIDRMVFFTSPLTNGHLKTEALLRRLPASWVHALEQATQRLPGPLAQRLLLQVGVRMRRL